MFTIKNKDSHSKARHGTLHTPHGDFETPFFMAVATKGSVKHLSSLDLQTIGARNIICNSLLFSLKPGLEVIKKIGGIHKYTNFNGCIFTDSGGFQASSDFLLHKIEHNRIIFNSPYGGGRQEITPEKAMDIQLTLGSDVAMCLDDMASYGATHRQVKSSMLNTHTWARIQKEYHDKLTKNFPKNKKLLLFGIAQGGIYNDLREISMKFIATLDFDGIAIGGLAIGETNAEMYHALQAQLPFLPENKMHYLMGLGSPPDIVKAISLGMDCFDSIFPTRNARHGTIFTFDGTLRLFKPEYGTDFSPIEKDCPCITCKNYTRSFIFHQLKENEGVGYRLATYHNITFMTRLMEKIRTSLKKGTFMEFKKDFEKRYKK